MGKMKLSKETKDEILQISYKYTAKELAQIYNCSRSTILKLWMDNNYHKETHNTYYVNKNYFKEINTSNKAYVLGLLTSDGTLYKRNNNSGLIQVKLQKSDEKILFDILQDMESTYPVNRVKNGNFTQVSISITSQDLYEQLLNKGLMPNKTWKLNLNTILSHIPKKFYIDFIRGYFDGDGCIGKFNDNQISKTSVSFACPYSFGLDLQELLKNEYNIKTSIYVDNRPKYSNIFCSLFLNGTNNKYKLLKLMYYNNALCLQRKQKIAKDFILSVETNTTHRKENIKAVNEFINYLTIYNDDATAERLGGFGSSGK